MKRRKHLETDFLLFLLEQQKEEEQEDEKNGEGINSEFLDKDEVQDEIEDESQDLEDDEEMIEKLTIKYKKLKNQYENILLNRKRK